jgi:Dolichyl-phosphate-mannose-protein mannosyltransferase
MLSGQPGAAPLAQPDLRLERVALALMGTLLALSLACRAVSTFVRAFHQDEFQLWYTAWMMSVGMVPGRDYAPPGYHAFIVDWLRLLFRLFPDSLTPLFLSRAVIFVLGLLILWVVYQIGRRLTDSRPAAVLAVLSITYHVAMVRRIGDVRADTLNVLAVLAALLALLAGPGRRPALLAGLALGLGLVSSPKVAIAFPVLLLAGLLLYGRTWARRALEVLGGGAIPVLLYLAVLGVSGLWQSWWQEYRHFAQVVAGAEARFSPVPTLLQSSRRDWPAAALWICCLVLAIAGWRSGREGGKRAAAVATFSVLYALLYVALNPVFFPYSFVDILPVVALAVPAAAAVLEAGRRVEIARLAVLLGVLLAVAGASETLLSTRRSNGLQLRYLDYIRVAVRPEERVFDLQGSHLFRRGTYHWHLVSFELPLYRSGKWFSVADELRRYRVSLIVRNYRLQWLPEEDWAFIRSHYVRAEPLLLFPGHLFVQKDGNRQPFEILVEGEYRFRSTRPEGVRVDGAPMGESVFLRAGDHTLEFVSSPSPSFALLYTTPEREARHLGAALGEEIVPSTE